MKLPMLAATTVACLAAFAPQANAIDRMEMTNATGLCQGALPAYENQLRKRPTGIMNQGPGNAFVSCSTTQNFTSQIFGHQAIEFGVELYNSTNASVLVTCTLVEGFNFFSFQYPKPFLIAAGFSHEGRWTVQDDAGGDPFLASLNLSCNLPAGVEISSVYWYSPEDGTAPAVE